MRREREIEPKPARSEQARPLSWGEREEQRRSRKAEQQVAGAGLLSRLHTRLTRFTRSIGLSRRQIVCDGVVYRERSNTSLRRALSAAGSGVKEYDVQFPDCTTAMESQQYPWREKMRIRYTHQRVFGDLGFDPRVRFVESIKDRIKPGFRVLELGCGTGNSSSMLAELVGPSGAVVAIDRDGESIRYARQRHRRNHLGFELGWLDTLEGELDGAFDAVIAVNPLREEADEPAKSRAAAAIWRVLRPGGVVGVLCLEGQDLPAVSDRLLAMGLSGLERYESEPTQQWGKQWGSCVGQRPESDSGNGK